MAPVGFPFPFRPARRVGLMDGAGVGERSCEDGGGLESGVEVDRGRGRGGRDGAGELRWVGGEDRREEEDDSCGEGVGERVKESGAGAVLRLGEDFDGNGGVAWLPVVLVVERYSERSW